MTGSIRLLLLGLIVLAAPTVAEADDEARPASEPQVAEDATYPPLGQELPPPFVPAHPRSAEDQQRVDALRLFVAARALEEQRKLTQAIKLLEQAHEKDPESVTILRRLSLLCFARGRTEQAIGYSKQALEADPGDTTTIQLLVGYYLRRSEPASAVALLEGLLANPKLDKHGSAHILIENDLGTIYSEILQQDSKAADAFAQVVEALDAKEANQLSLLDQKRILGSNEAETYSKFGETFLKAHRYDLAIRAFERGRVYAPDDPKLPLLEAQAMLKADQAEQALALLEDLLKGSQSIGLEAYDQLAKTLTALHREGEIIPRLEAAAQADPHNVSLQYALADRYRETGQPEKADQVYKALLAAQTDPEGFGALSESLRKEKKTAELLELIQETLKKPSGEEIVKPQVESIITDPAYTDEVLDTGRKLLEAQPPKLDAVGRALVVYIAKNAKKTDQLIALDRLALREDPSPQTYLELWNSLTQANRFTEAAQTLSDLIDQFPERKNPTLLGGLARSQMLAGENQKALETAREALRNPGGDDDPNLLQVVGLALTRLEKYDEAIAHYKDWLGQAGGNPELERLIHSGLSNVYISMDELDKGEAELEEILAKDPDDPGINNDLGYLYADRGKNLERAEAMIRKALAEEPDNSAYLDSLGWVLFKRGKAREAVEPLEKAASDRTDPTILDHLGEVYYRLQEYSKARDVWRRAADEAARSNPPDKRLPEIRKKLEALSKLEPAPRAASGETP